MHIGILCSNPKKSATPSIHHHIHHIDLSPSSQHPPCTNKAFSHHTLPANTTATTTTIQHPPSNTSAPHPPLSAFPQGKRKRWVNHKVCCLVVTKMVPTLIFLHSNYTFPIQWMPHQPFSAPLHVGHGHVVQDPLPEHHEALPTRAVAQRSTRWGATDLLCQRGLRNRSAWPATRHFVENCDLSWLWCHCMPLHAIASWLAKTDWIEDNITLQVIVTWLEGLKS